MTRDDLSPTMWPMLLLVRWAKRPGHIAAAGTTTLRALERRGLVTARPSRMAEHLAVWTPTAEGVELVTRESEARP